MNSHDLVDLIGVLVSLWYFVAIGALSNRAWVALVRLVPPRIGLAAAVAVSCTLYMVLYLLDVPGVLAVLTNADTDIPPASSLRTATLALLLTLCAVALNLLTPKRAK